MSVNEDLRILMLKECLTIEELTKMANKISDKKLTANSISKRLNARTMKYDDAIFLAKVMGYEIAFNKIK